MQVTETNRAPLSPTYGQPLIDPLSFAQYTADISTVAKAEECLKEKAPGTYIMFKEGTQSYCSVVGEDGSISTKPFGYDYRAYQYTNGGTSAAPMFTFGELLHHLLDHQKGIPYSGDLPTYKTCGQQIIHPAASLNEIADKV